MVTTFSLWSFCGMVKILSMDVCSKSCSMAILHRNRSNKCHLNQGIFIHCTVYPMDKWVFRGTPKSVRNCSAWDRANRGTPRRTRCTFLPQTHVATEPPCSQCSRATSRQSEGRYQSHTMEGMLCLHRTISIIACCGGFVRRRL